MPKGSSPEIWSTGQGKTIAIGYVDNATWNTRLIQTGNLVFFDNALLAFRWFGKNLELMTNEYFPIPLMIDLLRLGNN